MFEDTLFIVVLLAVAAVAIVLMIGLGGFAGGGAFNKKNSNKLMRYRILAQFIAVLLIVGFVWLRGGTG
ncbi:MAG: twin transmembrane helix small protein [Sulfitobacter sp.]